MNVLTKLHQSKSGQLRAVVGATLLALTCAGGYAVAEQKTVTLTVDGASTCLLYTSPPTPRPKPRAHRAPAHPRPGVPRPQSRDQRSMLRGTSTVSSFSGLRIA